LCLLSPQVSRSRCSLTAGARKGLICAVLPELSEGARIRCSSPSSSASGVEPTSRPPPRRQRAAVPPPERRPSGASRRTAIRAHAFGSLSGSHALLFADAELILFAVASFLASCDGCAHLIWSALMDTGRFASVVCVHLGPGARVAGCVWGPGSCRDVDCRSQCMPSG